jgi:hypothetical protein
MYVDDPAIYPLYAKCAELGCIVSHLQPDAGPDISYAEPWRISGWQMTSDIAESL